MGGVGGTEGPAAPLGTRPSGEIFSGFAPLSLRPRFNVFTEDDALPLRERECGYGSSEPSPTRRFQGHFQRNSQGAPAGGVALTPRSPDEAAEAGLTLHRAAQWADALVTTQVFPLDLKR